MKNRRPAAPAATPVAKATGPQPEADFTVARLEDDHADGFCILGKRTDRSPVEIAVVYDSCDRSPGEAEATARLLSTMPGMHRLLQAVALRWGPHVLQNLPIDGQEAAAWLRRFTSDVLRTLATVQASLAACDAQADDTEDAGDVTAASPLIRAAEAGERAGIEVGDTVRTGGWEGQVRRTFVGGLILIALPWPEGAEVTVDARHCVRIHATAPPQ